MGDGTRIVLLVGGPADGQRVAAAHGTTVVRIAEQPKMQWTSYKESTPRHTDIWHHEYYIEYFCGTPIGVHESLHRTNNPYDAVMKLLVQSYPPYVIRY